MQISQGRLEDWRSYIGVIWVKEQWGGVDYVRKGIAKPILGNGSHLQEQISMANVADDLTHIFA
jgi:hypothetical protein